MAGKEIPDLILERKPAATLEGRLKNFTKLTAGDQSLFNNGSFVLALNSGICGLVANSSFRRVLNITQAGFSTTASMFLLPFISTAVTYEVLVKQPLLAGNLNCEICALARGSLTGAAPGYLYPIVLALPLNAMLAARYCTSPMPNKESAFQYWLELTKPVIRKTRFVALLQIALGTYLGSKHHEIYFKMAQMPDPGSNPEELRE